MGRRYLGGSGERLTVWISLAASTVLIFYGYDQGVFGNVLVSEDFLRTMGYPSTTAQGTMTSVYNLGCFAGALSTLYTGDKLGRPRVLMLGSLIIAIAAIIQASSFSAAQMYVGRVVAGLGTGMNTATAGVWQSETSKMRSRGKLIIIQMANCITGFAISNWLTLGFSFAPGSVSWRFPLAFQMFFSGLVWLMCPYLPDSPRLLIRKGRYEEATEVLAALEGHGATPSSASVRTQFSIIKDILDREHAVDYTWWQLLTGQGPPGALRRMLLGAWMQAMNQVSGINVTSYYMTYVFINALGFSELRARILAAAGSMDYLFFSFMAYFVIERYGRRRVMMVSATACSMCWTIIAIAVGLPETGKGDSVKLGIVAVSFFFVFFASFAMGVLGVPWLYPTEINALAFRAKGSSLAMATNWICNYMVAEVTPIGIANLGFRFWIIWAVICAAFVPTTYLFYPETANRSLEDIDRFFEDNRGALVFRNKLATQLQRPAVYEEADQKIAAANEKSEASVEQVEESTAATVE
ncbi:putative MFS sugar transporter [Cryphonectria parasitica EP155]|uniref:MFS sugar transporter n=1 Tax=Cryphonectria parasitica (strain ATCC 38755 / EP155) TaxID=660469 RepID=A0A9P4Y2M7_CRYP1|nr:putative MFS sugar transporter [Cryphonectria parasitica EP155]KAF3765368.1 putative MFS sugar transporter [Cryphonectria parasitica EP155]